MAGFWGALAKVSVTAGLPELRGQLCRQSALSPLPPLIKLVSESMTCVKAKERYVQPRACLLMEAAASEASVYGVRA